MTQTEQEYSNMTTLLLSWQIARYMDLNQAGKIKRTARTLMNQTKDKRFYETYRKIAYSKRDTHVIDMIKLCYQGYLDLNEKFEVEI